MNQVIPAVPIVWADFVAIEPGLAALRTAAMSLNAEDWHQYNALNRDLHRLLDRNPALANADRDIAHRLTFYGGER